MKKLLNCIGHLTGKQVIVVGDSWGGDCALHSGNQALVLRVDGGCDNCGDCVSMEIIEDYSCITIENRLKLELVSESEYKKLKLSEESEIEKRERYILEQLQDKYGSV